MEAGLALNYLPRTLRSTLNTRSTGDLRGRREKMPALNKSDPLGD